MSGHDGFDELIVDLPNDLSAIEAAVEDIVRRCRNCDCHQGRLALNLRVSLSEALANAMQYGNEGRDDKRVRVEVTIAPETITARVIDQGRGFDPKSVPDPTHPENLLRSSGRGLFLMRQLMDEVHYNERGNCVTLVLRLSHRTDFGEAATA